MKIVNASHEIMPHPGINEGSILRRIERIGRVCYKSEDKITDTSAETFVGNIIKRNHGAVVEHGSLLFMTDTYTHMNIRCDVMRLENIFGIRSFLRMTTNEDNSRNIVSGNIRAWREFIENCQKFMPTIPAYLYSVIHDYSKLFPEYAPGILKETADLFRKLRPITVDELQTDVEIKVHYDISILFTCDRGVTHEIVRHRPASYAQESTRYCNYTLGKFGTEITVVKPSWCEEDSEAYYEWQTSCENAETRYFWMVNELGCTPQEARSVLPTSTKAEIVMTAPVGEWQHFFDLRTSSAAHPDIRALAIPAQSDLKKMDRIGKFF